MAEKNNRRQLVDRRIRSVLVKHDRRLNSRREADKKEDVAPDWLNDALSEAAQRVEENPAFSPPQVDEKENQYFLRSNEEKRKKEKLEDLFILSFVVLCFISIIFLIYF